MSTMNPDVKAQWVAALRSGEYKQAVGALRREDCFCCLGVLSDICDSSRWKPATNTDEMLWDQNGIFLPEVVAKWAGLWPCTDGPAVLVNGVVKPLAGHNDSGATFAEIADAIEAQL